MTASSQWKLDKQGLRSFSHGDAGHSFRQTIVLAKYPGEDQRGNGKESRNNSTTAWLCCIHHRNEDYGRGIISTLNYYDLSNIYHSNTILEIINVKRNGLFLSGFQRCQLIVDWSHDFWDGDKAVYYGKCVWQSKLLTSRWSESRKGKRGRKELKLRGRKRERRVSGYQCPLQGHVLTSCKQVPPFPKSHEQRNKP